MSRDYNKIADDVINACNGGERELAKAIHSKLIREHRTIQASFIRAMRDVMYKYAHENNGTDARNEGAVNWCVEISKTGGAIPYI